MLHFDAAESQVVIAVVVKRVYVLSLNRLLIGTDDVPPAARVVRERRVIGLTQIRALANRRKSLELDGNDLSPSRSRNVPPPSGSVSPMKACSTSSRSWSTGLSRALPGATAFWNCVKSWT